MLQGPLRADAGQGITPADFVMLMEAAENALQSCEARLSLTLEYNPQLRPAKPPPEFANGDLLSGDIEWAMQGSKERYTLRYRDLDPDAKIKASWSDMDLAYDGERFYKHFEPQRSGRLDVNKNDFGDGWRPGDYLFGVPTYKERASARFRRDLDDALAKVQELQFTVTEQPGPHGTEIVVVQEYSLKEGMRIRDEYRYAKDKNLAFLGMTKTGDGKLRLAMEVRELRQTDSGIWIPTQFSETRYQGDPPEWFRKVSYSAKEWKVNQPVDPLAFVIRFPPGTSLHDAIRNVTYTVPEPFRPDVRRLAADAAAPTSRAADRLEAPATQPSTHPSQTPVQLDRSPAIPAEVAETAPNNRTMGWAVWGVVAGLVALGLAAYLRRTSRASDPRGR